MQDRDSDRLLNVVSIVAVVMFAVGALLLLIAELLSAT